MLKSAITGLLLLGQLFMHHIVGVSFLSIVQQNIAKTKYSKFYNDCFFKILGVQEAGSLGVIWLNTVVFLWILVNKHSVNISSNGNTQLIFYMLLIY